MQINYQGHIERNIIISQFLSNKPDSQRAAAIISADDFEKNVHNLYKSTQKFGYDLYILTNELDSFDFRKLHIRRQKLDVKYNPLNLYFQRWIMTYEFLLAHPEVEKIVQMDLTDTEIQSSVFEKIEENKLYVGDDIFGLDSYITTNDIVPTEIRDFLDTNRNLQLLNPGIIAGSRNMLLKLLSIMIFLMDTSLDNNGEFGNFDMSLFNYVAYKYFNKELVHGRKITTKFLYQEQYSKSWFKHK